MQPVLGARRFDRPQGPGEIIDISIPDALALFSERGSAETPGRPTLGVVILRGAAAGESGRGAIGLFGGVAVKQVDPDDDHIGSAGDSTVQQRCG